MEIKVKKYIEKEDSNEVLVIKETVTFDPATSIQEYEDRLQKLPIYKKLVNGKFNESRWSFHTENYDIRNIYFNHELNPKMNLKLKAYALTKIENCGLSGVVTAVRLISDFMYLSNYSDKEYLYKVQNELKTWSKTKLANTCYVGEFLNFIDIGLENDYIALISNIPAQKRDSRTLPSYHSIINFEFIMQDFILNADSETKIKFYPVIIWWELTKIIPMRPCELLDLPRNCIEFDGENYYINIIRKKQRNNGKVKYKTIKPLNKIKIHFELYSLIKNYVDHCNTINNNDNLFSYNVLRESLKSKRGYEFLSQKLKFDIVDEPRLINLTSYFFDEVVTQKYGYKLFPKEEKHIDDYTTKEIEKILPGDTRHIAFCGMMLQGFNPLTIAQIGGHETLSEQKGYSSHFDDYITSHTYMMAKEIKNKLSHNINVPIGRSPLNSKSNLIKDSLVGLEKYEGLKIPGGRCLSNNFPYECNSDGHYCCIYFIPDETLTQELINKELLKTNNEIEIKTSFIKSTFKQLILAELDDENSNVITQGLKTDTNSLNTLLRNKAILQAYKMHLSEED